MSWLQIWKEILPFFSLFSIYLYIYQSILVVFFYIHFTISLNKISISIFSLSKLFREMGFPSHAITVANHSALKSLENLTMIFTNLLRPNHTNVEDDEIVDPSPSLVLLPDHIIISKSINMDHLPVVEYATLKQRSQVIHDEEEEEEDEDETSSCAVCLSEIEGGHNVRVLGNCEHAFHVDCLDSWMDHGHATCPLCRAHLVSRHGNDPWRSERMVYLFGQDCLLEHLSWIAFLYLVFYH